MRQLYEGECDKCGDRQEFYCRVGPFNYLFVEKENDFPTCIYCVKCKVGKYVKVIGSFIVKNPMKGKWNKC